MTKQENDSLREFLIANPPVAGASIEETRAGFEARSAQAPIAAGVSVSAIDMAGVPSDHLRPAKADGGAILYLHGGGYVMGSARTHRSLGAAIAVAAQASVYLVDYRLAPEHPFPAASDDALAAYRSLIDGGQARQHLAVTGDSAGGGLAVAMLMAARDAGLPLPAACVAISPWTDMTCSGDSYDTKRAFQPNIERDRLKGTAASFMAGHDPRDPLASPIFGDLAGLPPLLIQVGREEALLDDSRALHDRAKAAGVESTLELWDDMVHVWHIHHHRLSEGRDAIERVGGFLTASWQARAA